jgi:hypothetical protein
VIVDIAEGRSGEGPLSLRRHRGLKEPPVRAGSLGNSRAVASVRTGLTAGGSWIRTVGPAENKAGIRLLTFDHEELVGRGFGPPNLAFATSELPHAGVAVG